MRETFASALLDLMARDHRAVLLIADIGGADFVEHARRFPDRFRNVGVAEANMVAMAAGMALEGLRPFALTQAVFATARVVDQARFALCQQCAAVTIVGTGAGLGFTAMGPSHEALADVAMMRCLPGMTVVCPGDAMEVRAAVDASISVDGPVYLRLGRSSRPFIHEIMPEFVVGRGIVLREGDGVCFIANGSVLSLAWDVVEILRTEHGMRPGLVSMHTVKPLDAALLARVFSQYQLVVTVEEHTLLGGFSSAIAEWLVDRIGPSAALLRIGLRDEFVEDAPLLDDARTKCGLRTKDIVRAVLQRLIMETYVGV